MDKRPLARITLRHVRDTARFRRDRQEYYPWCRGHDCHEWPHWNLRFEYQWIRVRGGGQSFYYCDDCLPAKYREVADSMLRGGEKERIIEGATAEDLRASRTTPAANTPTASSRIPWRSLL